VTAQIFWSNTSSHQAVFGPRAEDSPGMSRLRPELKSDEVDLRIHCHPFESPSRETLTQDLVSVLVSVGLTSSGTMWRARTLGRIWEVIEMARLDGGGHDVARRDTERKTGLKGRCSTTELRP
jgi:hypothetical protein